MAFFYNFGLEPEAISRFFWVCLKMVTPKGCPPAQHRHVQFIAYSIVGVEPLGPGAEYGADLIGSAAVLWVRSSHRWLWW